MGYADLLSADIETLPPAQQHEYLMQIRDSSEQMLAYVENVFLAARAQSGKLDLHLDRIDVGDLLQRVAGHAPNGVDVLAPPPLAPVEVVADQRHLRTALGTFLTRMTRFAMPGADIFVHLSVCGRNEACIEFSYTPTLERHDCAASNVAGCTRAVPPADFDGLALAVAVSIIERHGGAVDVRDSRITLRLEAAETQTAALTRAAA